jgi:hypothetical protein
MDKVILGYGEESLKIVWKDLEEFYGMLNMKLNRSP